MAKYMVSELGSTDGSALSPVLAAPAQDLARPLDPLSLDPFGGEAPVAPVGRPTAVTLKTLLRYKWIALAVFLLLAAPGAAAVYYFYQPLFQAVATVEVSPIIPRLVYRTDDNGMIPLYQQYLNTQVGVIRSPQVLQRVLDLPEVRKTDWFRNPPRPLLGEAEPPLDRLRDMLDVAPRGGTYVVDVTTTTPAPPDAAVLANAIVEQYLTVSRENMKQADDALLVQLNDEYRQLRASIEGLEATIAKLRNDLGTGDPEQLLSNRRVRLDTMVAESETLRREIELTSWRLKRLTMAADGGTDESAEGGTPSSDEGQSDWKYASDAEWRKLYLDLESAKHRLEVEGQRLGDAHPTMVELRSNEALAAKLLHTREEILDRTWTTASAGPGTAAGAVGPTPAAERATLERTLAELEYREELIQTDVEKLRAEVQRTAEVVRLLAKEGDALRHQRDLYEAVRTRKTEREMESRVPGSIHVQSQAVAPSAPSNSKRRVMFLGLVVAAGAFAGLGAAYVRAMTNRSVLNATDVTEPARAAFLGHVPAIRNPEQPTPHEELILGEHVRMVRTALLERLDARRGQAVLLSSAGPRVGKTTLAFQLARSFAQCGLRVLLVDADLRNCAVSRRSGAEGRRGLVDLLAYGAAEGDVIVGTDQPGLQILPAGRLPDRSLVEVLADPNFGERVRSWRERYNVILLDSPPVLPVADAAILARVADGTVVVAREGHCRRPDVLEAMARLSTCGAKLLGLVYIGSGRAPSSTYYDSGYYLPLGGATNRMDAREGAVAS